jgi:hypothetical protein
MCPSIMEILGAFELAYEARGDKGLAADARTFALGYDADHVAETYWKPVLAALDSPREVPALVPANRQMRRAMAKAGS